MKSRVLNTQVVLLLLMIIFMSGCSSIGKIENKAITKLPNASERYTASNHSAKNSDENILFLLAFSGGGTRAAALSYGVLEELRDTKYSKAGKQIRLLDEIDKISSVSGGSFTAAYYGLFGEQIFDDYKEVFLYKDVQGDLKGLFLGFFKLIGRLFSIESRTEVAINYYDKHIFRGKTFADLKNNQGPFILLNATDLNSQSQFVFTQDQFDFFCSDISQFKIARAVAASSAVPIIFPPILLKRHDNCDYKKPLWLSQAEKKSNKDDDDRLKRAVGSLDFYLDKNNPPFATLIDGGVTDNLGLRTITNTVKLSGGAKKVFKRDYKDKQPPKQLVIIVVNASTSSETEIGKTSLLPSIVDTLSVVTDIQLHLYNTETNALLKEELKDWAKKTSTKEHPMKHYFIELDVTGISDPKDRIFFNRVPTSFSIEREQADRLIELARELLRNNVEFKKLLAELKANS